MFIFLLISQVSLYKIMFHKFVARYFTICTSVVEYLYKRLKLLQFSHALCKYFTIYFCLPFTNRIPELNQYLSLNICVFCFFCDRCHQTSQSACIVLWSWYSWSKLNFLQLLLLTHCFQESKLKNLLVNILQSASTAVSCWAYW